jgi:hypothetical protein
VAHGFRSKKTRLPDLRTTRNSAKCWGTGPRWVELKLETGCVPCRSEGFKIAELPSPGRVRPTSPPGARFAW